MFEQPYRTITVSPTRKYRSDELKIPERYPPHILNSGGEIVVVDGLMSEEEIIQLLISANVLFLIGGGDIEPSLYGQERHEKTESPDLERDRVELLLIKWALALNIPIIAICRGHQIVNVALGGELDQHILNSSNIEHGRKNPQAVHLYERRSHHRVMVKQGSHLEALFGGKIIEPASMHHQRVKRVGTGLVAVAYAEDGTIEATESPDGMIVTVQFHPEASSKYGYLYAQLMAKLAENPEPQERGNVIHLSNRKKALKISKDLGQETQALAA